MALFQIFGMLSDVLPGNHKLSVIYSGLKSMPVVGVKALVRLPKPVGVTKIALGIQATAMRLGIALILGAAAILKIQIPAQIVDLP